LESAASLSHHQSRRKKGRKEKKPQKRKRNRGERRYRQKAFIEKGTLRGIEEVFLKLEKSSKGLKLA